MRLHSLRIKNYKCLKDVTLTDLPPFCAFIGANGTGKSTLFDALKFAREFMMEGGRKAFSARSGYSELVSAGCTGEDIEFRFEVDSGTAIYTYHIAIGVDNGGSEIVREEWLKKDGAVIFTREDFSLSVEMNAIVSFLALMIVRSEKSSELEGEDFINFMMDLRTYDISIPHIRAQHNHSYNASLTSSGGNLAAVALQMFNESRDVFEDIIFNMRRYVPGLQNVEVRKTEDERVILKFKDGEFDDPFSDRNMSDGTMRLFAYLLMLRVPEERSLLCVEEPENYLYPTIQQDLAEEFRAYANRGGQVFVSTHSPDFLNALNVDEVVWLVKENGFTKAVRAKDDPQVVAYMNEGDRMGYLWKEGFFKGVHP